MKKKLIAGIVIVWLAPLAMYWQSVGRWPTVGPDEAKEMLSGPGSEYALVDTREDRDFAAGHVEGAVSWPHAEIMALAGPEGVPEALRGKKLLLLCYSGLSSAQAARRLTEAGVPAFSIHGGMETWTAVGGRPCPLALCRLASATGEVRNFPSRPSTLLEQWVTSISAFGLKPAYMLLSFILIIRIRKLTAGDLVALRWGLIWFLAGESFCAVNYLFFGEASYFVEYMHSFGMTLAFGSASYALMLALDHRLVRYGDAKKNCALLEQCGTCIKHADAPCAVRRIYQLLLMVFMVLAFLPLTADYHDVSYNTEILGTAYTYSHPVVYQIFEIRFCPELALVLFAVGLAAFRLRREGPLPFVKIMFAAGLGFLCFSLFRLVLFQVYRDNLTWFVFWEEATELIYVAGAGAVVWIFRGRLFREEEKDTGQDNRIDGTKN